MENFSFVPTRVFFTKGVGRHKHYLQSFDLALKDAGFLLLISCLFLVFYRQTAEESAEKRVLKTLNQARLFFALWPETALTNPIVW